MKKLGKLLFITSLLLCFLIPRGWTQTQAKNQPDSIELKLKEIYTKREVMIPMRDGIKLYTAVYEPKDNSRQHPILMHRSPYSCSPYGEGFDRHFRTNLKNYIEHRYIIVFQDVRGRHKSEGIFIQVRPLNKNKKGKKDKKNIDEATDTYDTIEWLIHNTYNNGNVGTWGISYDGFYATMTASSNHPALKAVSPQAPVTDWFRGDDRHHNGAFTLLQTTNFLPRLEGRHIGKGVMNQIVKNDVYTDFLTLGTFKNVDDLVRDTTQTLWNDIKNHPDFDDFWKERDARITSIYEGTTQLQTVAAIRYVTNGSYIATIREFEAIPCSPEMEPLMSRLKKMADKFEASTNAVKEVQDQELLDFTARKLVEMAADIIMCHLLIQDASKSSELFSKSAHVYLNYAEAEVEKHTNFIENFDKEDLAFYKK